MRGSSGAWPARMLALLCVLASAAFAQQGDVSARLGALAVPVDETVTLTVDARDVVGELDTTALERDFDVVVRSRANRFEIVNGTRSTLRTFVLELTPRTVGVYTVPPVRVGAAESDPLTLEVKPPARGAERDFFIEASVDDASPFVQAQAVLTLGLWIGSAAIDLELDPPRGAGLIVEPLGDARRHARTRDGRDYDVLEQRYALFAETSGEILVEPGSLVVTLPADPTRARGLLSPTRRAVRRAEPLVLDVRPRPPGGPAWWLPASEVTLEARFPAGTDARVGEPLTRTVALRATGVRAEQLPAIPSPRVDGASVHADAPETGATVQDDVLVAERRFVQAIIPQAPGALKLPGMELDWFDTGSGAWRTATLAPVTLEVAPSARSAGGAPATPAAPAAPAMPAMPAMPATPATPDADAPPRASASGDGPRGAARDAPPADGSVATGLAAPIASAQGSTDTGWRTLAVVALIGWLASAALAAAFWRRRRGGEGARGSAVDVPGRHDGGPAQEVPRRRPGAASTDLARAVREGSAIGVRDAALALAARRFADDPPPTLPALAGRIDDADVRRALIELDRGLYGRASVGAADGVRLAALAPGFERALEEALGDAVLARRTGREPPMNGLPPLA